MVAVASENSERRSRQLQSVLGHPRPEALCLICRKRPVKQPKSRVGRKSAICDDALCQKIRRGIYNLLHNALRGSYCCICGDETMDGETHCKRHHHLPDPCPGVAGKACGALIVRRSGRGNQPKHCGACRKGSAPRSEP